MSGRTLVVVGDALLDRDVEGRVERLCPDAPVPVFDEEERTSRPGGAGLAASLAADDGYRVVLVTALATDPAGRELAALLSEAGVEVVDLGLGGVTPEKVRVLAGGRSLLRLDRGGREPGPVGAVTDAARDALSTADAVLVADYGRGLTAAPGLRAALTEVAAGVPLVWDPHPRGAEPVEGVRLVTPNSPEAERLVPEAEGASPVAGRALALSHRWNSSVAVTLGPEGALLAGPDGNVLNVPAPKVSAGDPCGAGDRFASRAAGLLADGATVEQAVAGAVLAASGFVAAGGAAGASLGGTVEPENVASRADAEDVVSSVRAAGGTVVATGGCFDLLHAGHVNTLRAARALGDCLVVCLNSDASVRRLKGSDRPLVPEEDRAAVLEALGCVDAVVVFDEDTPEAVLERLRPDVFAKGADYAVSELPEAKLLQRWGGRAVILPYVAGRSTTRLIQQAVDRSVS